MDLLWIKYFKIISVFNKDRPFKILVVCFALLKLQLLELVITPQTSGFMLVKQLPCIFGFCNISCHTRFLFPIDPPAAQCIYVPQCVCTFICRVFSARFFGFLSVLQRKFSNVFRQLSFSSGFSVSPTWFTFHLGQGRKIKASLV